MNTTKYQMGFDLATPRDERSTLTIGLTPEQHAATLRAACPPGDEEGAQILRDINTIEETFRRGNPTAFVRVIIVRESAMQKTMTDFDKKIVGSIETNPSVRVSACASYLKAITGGRYIRDGEVEQLSIIIRNLEFAQEQLRDPRKPQTKRKLTPAEKARASSHVDLTYALQCQLERQGDYIEELRGKLKQITEQRDFWKGISEAKDASKQ